jgi:chloramphenicol-sensitive protein RarD
VKLQNNMTVSRPERTGIIHAASAYVIWGIIPIYWKQITEADAAEIVAHRIVWTLAFTLLLLQFSGRLGQLVSALRDLRAFAALVVSSILIALNWGIFIWAVMSDRIIETSLGYYINPLVSFLLGVVFLKERLTGVQKLAVGLAALAVANQTWALGYLPWVSLVLAASFGVYGLIRKTVNVESIEGLTVETIVLVPISIFYLSFLYSSGALSFGHHGIVNDVLLVLAGPLTAIPLLLFASGARRIPLFMIGFLQYLAPTISLSLAVFLYDETFTAAHSVTFALIWIALALVSFDAFRRERYNPA